MPDPRLSSPPEPSPDPTLPFGPLTMALGDPIRWAILRELASGDRLMVVEIAKRVGKPADTVSKHLAVLRRVGLAVAKQRLYSMPPEFLADPEKRVLDLGYCVLRLDSLPG